MNVHAGELLSLIEQHSAHEVDDAPDVQRYVELLNELEERLRRDVARLVCPKKPTSERAVHVAQGYYAEAKLELAKLINFAALSAGIDLSHHVGRVWIDGGTLESSDTHYGAGSLPLRYLYSTVRRVLAEGKTVGTDSGFVSAMIDLLAPPSGAKKVRRNRAVVPQVYRHALNHEGRRGHGAELRL